MNEKRSFLALMCFGLVLIGCDHERERKKDLKKLLDSSVPCPAKCSVDLQIDPQGEIVKADKDVIGIGNSDFANGDVTVNWTTSKGGHWIVVFNRYLPFTKAPGSPCINRTTGKLIYFIEQGGSVPQCVITKASFNGLYYPYTAIVDGAVSDPGIAHTN